MYQVIMSNQDTGVYMDLIRETKIYLFLRHPKAPFVVTRVNKKTLNQKHYKYTRDGVFEYAFDGVRLNILKKLKYDN